MGKSRSDGNQGKECPPCLRTRDFEFAEATLQTLDWYRVFCVRVILPNALRGTPQTRGRGWKGTITHTAMATATAIMSFPNN
jgi:hypothetical protein